MKVLAFLLLPRYELAGIGNPGFKAFPELEEVLKPRIKEPLPGAFDNAI